MSKLIMMRGLVASGKSTKAKEIVEQGNWVRLNRDLLRTMLHYDKWTGKNEGLTIDAEKYLARYYLVNGTSVVIDDTNLGEKHKKMWSDMAEETDSKFQVITCNTPVEECLKRDSARTDKPPVGRHVIMGMALQYGLYPKPEKPIVLCDIDGTVADIKHRLHYVNDVKKKDWKGFFAEMHNDIPRPSTIDILLEYEGKGHQIMFVTARPDTYREVTEAWLEKTFKGYPLYTTVIMRKGGDARPDIEVKQQILDTYFKDKYDIECVIDDRPSVIRMWRENGLKVIDVGEGKEF